MERVKAMQRGQAAASAAESYRPELLADEEPRYLRRQKPLEIRRRKFGGRTWQFYRRVFVWTVICAAGVTMVIVAGRFLLYSPQVLLLKSDQIELLGNHIVSREAVLQPFAHDHNRSVLRISLDDRRTELEQMPWVESASVMRILPNRIRVELTERTPIAFLRNGTDLALIDAHGVILDRPDGEDLHFPIVTGLPEGMPREEREKRMETYQEFLRDAGLVRSGSADRVSEVDLSNAKDLRVVMTGLANGNDSQAVTIHFGSGDFSGKYRMLVENFAQWQANAGHVQSIDLQYSRQVVVNADSTTNSAKLKN
ncbi:MAG TPA: FtsQ-type POTRA domain-containing protein [Candidatus Acidoferrum sp.]|nr:FtsQ-type POTRA domain-containing protein [Candidatus Acidoferrum sp.]